MVSEARACAMRAVNTFPDVSSSTTLVAMLDMQSPKSVKIIMFALTRC